MQRNAKIMQSVCHQKNVATSWFQNNTKKLWKQWQNIFLHFPPENIKKQNMQKIRFFAFKKCVLIPMSRRLKEVAIWDFSKLTLPHWISRSEVSYGSIKNKKTAFMDQTITNITKHRKIKFSICVPCHFI